jgi:hypothetical protein
VGKVRDAKEIINEEVLLGPDRGWTPGFKGLLFDPLGKLRVSGQPDEHLLCFASLSISASLKEAFWTLPRNYLETGLRFSMVALACVPH